MPNSKCIFTLSTDYKKKLEYSTFECKQRFANTFKCTHETNLLKCMRITYLAFFKFWSINYSFNKQTEEFTFNDHIDVSIQYSIHCIWGVHWTHIKSKWLPRVHATRASRASDSKIILRDIMKWNQFKFLGEGKGRNTQSLWWVFFLLQFVFIIFYRKWLHEASVEVRHKFSRIFRQFFNVGEIWVKVQ